MPPDGTVQPPPRLVVLAAAGAVLVTGLLLAVWHLGARGFHDPFEGLQQLDLLYLRQPAPHYQQLGFQRGRPGLLLVCGGCPAPDVGAQVVRSTDPAVARDYALVTASGRVGPGYALIDGDGRVRYRTFDPSPAAHADEIAVLLGAL